MYFITNFNTMLMIATSTFSFSASWSEYTNAHAQLKHVSRLMNTLIKIASNSRSNLCSG